MKRKAASKGRARPRAKPSSLPPPRAKERKEIADPIAAMIAGAPALGLAIDVAWEENVKFNLQLILRHAALVDEFPLPDEAEPAPIFYA